MKTKKPVLIALAVLMLVPGVVFGAKKWEKIKTPEMRDVIVPQVHRESMDNGIELFVLEDHELPLFRMTLVMKGGSAHNPKNKLGLAGLTAEVLRSGGSSKVSGDELDEILESSGGSVETSVRDKSTTIRINMLIEDAQEALEIVRDLLLNPAYPEDKIDLAMTQSRSAISRRNDDPGGIADREFEKVLYGADHPFVQQIEYEHLDNISRSDLLEYHKKYYHPTNAYLALWGDFETAEAIAMVKEVLGAWPKTAVRYPKIPDVPEVTSSVNLVIKESVTQSNIRMGHRSVTRKHPDYYSLVVMNELLGGGLGSRLFNAVRSRQGLAYRVGSGLGANLEDPGMFRVVCGTKSETTVKALQACVAEVERMKNELVTDEELKRAKDGLLNSHVFNFANKGAIVNRQMRFVSAGYPADFVEKFSAQVQQVSAEDVKSAAENFLKPENFATLVVGRPGEFDSELSVLGEVNEIDITIPEPAAPEFPEPTPETLAKGKELIAHAAKAMGGKETLANVRNLTAKATLTISMMGQKIPAKATRYMRYPGNTRMEIAVMGQEIVQVFNSDTGTGFANTPQGKKVFEEKEIMMAKESIAHDLVVFLGKYEDFGPYYLEDSEVEGAKAMVVIMTPPEGRKFKVYIDAETHHPVKLEHAGENPMGAPVHEETIMSDFRMVGNVKLPYAAKIFHDGELFMELTNTEISVTDAIPDDKFAQGE